MKYSDPKTVALLFNEYINSRDLENLTDLMTDDHTFISISGKIEKGRKEMKEGWANFFSQYPDYQNIFNRVESDGNRVIMIGHSECSERTLDGPAIWTALIEDGLVKEWRVYDDDEKTRAHLSII